MAQTSAADGWVKELSTENFLAVYDVLLDICSELQLGRSPHVPILPAVIRFPQLMPADSINLRDRYCTLRVKAAEFLKEKGAINSIQTFEHGHRWDSTLELKVNEGHCVSLQSLMDQEYRRRSMGTKPDEDDKEAPAVRSEFALPQLVTLPWLFKHVPIKAWISLAVIIVGVFVAGARAGQTSFARELLGAQSATPSVVLKEGDVKERVDRLVDGHNLNTARITEGIVGEERMAGQSSYASESLPHSEAAQRLRDLLKQEDERFESSLRELRDLQGK